MDMIFSSLNFLFIFLPIVLLLYYVLPWRFKNLLLLVASIIFYAWGEPIYIILMLLSITFNYVAGMRLELLTTERERKLQLLAAVVFNLLMLGFFKYAPLFVNTVMRMVHVSFRWKGLALPIGISFYTFQAMSYVIDVYRQKVRAQKKIIDFAVYITMFPQLIAGPIVKYADIEKQLKHRKLSVIKSGQGLERLIYGLSKKVLLANNIGLLHDNIVHMQHPSVLSAWLGIAAYAFQLYFDFSGYSDMAIGMGKMLGFTFPENFDFPYVAKSVSEFWRRWHISLSSWFSEYVYIPLGGNRCSVPRHIFNLMVVWMLTGFWHGAGWNFLLWGFFLGLMLILEKYVLGKYIESWPNWLRHVYTMGVFGISLVFFFNTDFAMMGRYLGNMIGIGAHGFVDSSFFYYVRNNLVLIILCVIFAGTSGRRILIHLSKKKPIISAVVSAVLLILSVAFLVYGSYNPFLYFRF